MTVGDVDVTIIEDPTALTISAALSAMVTSLSISMNYTTTALGMGKGVLLTGVEQQLFKF